jgi:large subunit ribosomal protein L13
MIVINGKDMVVGRVATFAAKQALLGEEVKIVNCEQMYITGSKSFLVNETHRRRVQGTWSKGPFYWRQPDRFVRRIIRGMLPHKTARGKDAFRRVLCYKGLPEAMKNENPITLENAHIKKIPNLRYMTVAEICKHMGAK